MLEGVVDFYELYRPRFPCMRISPLFIAPDSICFHAVCLGGFLRTLLF